MASPNQRLAILEKGEQLGILKPEHVQELAHLRAVQSLTGQGGSSRGGGGGTTADDKKALNTAQDQANAASATERLYDNVEPAIKRFDGGPMKGTIYDMVMPSSGGGFWDGVGSFLGSPVRALLPSQDKSDYKAIDTARQNRIALRQMEQKGVQTEGDAKRYGKSDIDATNYTANNLNIIRQNRVEAELTKMRAYMQSKWVAQYGSTSHASPNGTTYSQAVDNATKDYMQGTAQRVLHPAPPSTRRAPNNGWSVTEVK